MTIDFYSDFACPYCYIAKINLDKAIQTIDYDNEINVIYKAYQLNEKAPKTTTLTSYEVLAKKYSKDATQVKKQIDKLTEKIQSEGITMNYHAIQMTNTFDAHRIMGYAQSIGKEKAVSKALFKAYFQDGENLSDHDTLRAIAKQQGLDDNTVNTILNSDEYKTTIKNHRAEAHAQNIKGVPLVIINNTMALEGSQSVKAYLNAIREAKKIKQPQFSSGSTCDDESCNYN